MLEKSMKQAKGPLALSALLLIAGCSGKPKQAAGPEGAAGGAMGPMPVSVATVTQQDVPVTGEWVGTMDGYVNAQIQPQVSGYLIRQLYREGSQVGKGQVLFQIDPRPFQAALEQTQGQAGQAQGQLGQAQAQLGLAQINVARDTPLAAEKAIAQSQLDNDKQQALQAEAGVRQAKAQIAAAQANIATARLNLGFTQVRSLISGVAGQATVQVGNLVSPQSVLTAVSQLNPIRVYFSISDSEYLALTHRERGGAADLLKAAGSLPLTLTLANGTVYPQKGHVVFVDRQLNQQTGAIRIAAAFANPGNVLRPGQFARVKANTEVLHGALLIPQAAVQELQGVQQVFTVGADNKIHVKNVELGQQYNNQWVVKGGLQPGERVVMDNLQKLREGSPVDPHAAASDAAPTSLNSTDNTGR